MGSCVADGMVLSTKTWWCDADIFPDKVAFQAKVRALITADPGLPRPSPTQSFWQLPPHPGVSNIQSPVLPKGTDIVIIGSGITGCSVARSLLEDEPLGPVHVTILEARTLVSGATGRNGVSSHFRMAWFASV